MKRKTFIRVTLMLLLSLAVFAAINVSASAAKVTAKIGSEIINIDLVKPVDGVYKVSLPIDITESSGMLTATLKVSYPDEFNLVGWTEGSVFAPEDNLTSTDTVDLALNPFTVMYYTYNTNNTATGTLITLNFEIPEDINPDKYVISAVVTDSVAQGSDVNAYPDDITESFTITSGSIIIEENPNGSCGENLTWKLNTATGVLTISGTGTMSDYVKDGAPWFKHVDKITSIELDNGITSIGAYAFASTDITSITIPASVEAINENAFYNSLDLLVINVDDENANYSSENGILFDKNKTTLVTYPAGKLDEVYTVPESVTAIGAKAFFECPRPLSIVIGKNVTAIGEDAITNPSASISGYSGSAAEAYATANGIEFIDITPSYEIKFFDKDGITLIYQAKYKEGTNVELPKPNEYEHLEFAGWSTGVEGEALITTAFKAKKPLTLTAVYDEEEKFTVTIKATDGGLLIHNGETKQEFIIRAFAGEVLIFEAIDDPSHDEECKIRNWYDITNGQCISVINVADGLAPTVLEYTVTKDISIDANFIHVGYAAPVRLVAFIGRGNYGYITANDGDKQLTDYDEYASANEATKLTAVAYDGYTPAYWVRISQDSYTDVLVTTGADAYVYPLGGTVYYQPVFKAATDDPTDLYIDAATGEIFDFAPSESEYTIVLSAEKSVEGVVNVYECTKGKDSAENNLFTAYDIDGNVIGKAQKPAFADNIIVKKTKTNDAPLWTIKLGDNEFIASYKDNFSFNYMFAAGTDVKVYEKTLTGEATPGVSTVATWTEGTGSDTITRFTGLYALPEGYTLVNHGVMMSQNRNDLAKLKDNSTGDLNVENATIVGRVSDNSENATPLFTIAKRLASETDVWYGRAFLVYTDGTNTYVKYADDVLPSAEGSVDIIEGTTPGNQDIYGPEYWDDSIAFGE